VLVVLGHREAEIGDGGPAVRQQPAVEIGVGPGARNHFGTVGRHPIFLHHMGKIVDKARRNEVAFLERLLQRRRAPLDWCGWSGCLQIIRHSLTPAAKRHTRQGA
jgi:hypothetical protein